MKLKAALIFALILGLFSVCAGSQNKANDVEFFSEINLLKHLKSLSSDAFEGRRTGTKGALKAQKFIINQFHSLGVKPLIKSYKQPFMFFEDRKQYDGVNVLGVIEGTQFSDKYIVISAHYDHEGIHNGEIFNGADDNASGVSALISFAEFLKNNPPKHSIILAAFDAEELGLQGSKFFVKNSTLFPSKEIVLNMNMDMISRSDKDELFVSGASENKTLKCIIDNFESTSRVKLIPGHDGYDGLDNWTYASDHANFNKNGIPFLYFGVEDHKDYHEPTDTFENIHPEFYVESVKTIISVFKRIDNTSF